MTGYGRAEKEARNVLVEAELRSVNGRHLSVRCRLPGEWMRLEPGVETLVRTSLSRGAVDAVVRIHVATHACKPVIDESILAVYERALRRLGGGDTASLLRLPGVVSMSEPDVSPRALERAVTTAVRAALKSLVASREAEGQRLCKVLGREVGALRRHLAVVKRLLPTALRRHQASLRKRLGSLLDRSPLDQDDPTLLREVAVLAERCDVTEEFDRLTSHVAALETALESSGAMGRELDFLLQEVGREVNTLGAKCNDAAVTERVVRIKGCVERLREQAANIE